MSNANQSVNTHTHIHTYTARIETQFILLSLWLFLYRSDDERKHTESIRGWHKRRKCCRSICSIALSGPELSPSVLTLEENASLTFFCLVRRIIIMTGIRALNRYLQRKGKEREGVFLALPWYILFILLIALAFSLFLVLISISFLCSDSLSWQSRSLLCNLQHHHHHPHTFSTSNSRRLVSD